MAEEKKNKIPPLVDLKVSNPIEYIKLWWKKIIGNEGIEFRLSIHPLTAIAIALAIASVGFGLGRFVMPFSVPFFKYEEVNSSPTPKPEDWKETAFTGTIHFSSTTSKYFLTTTSASEAITLTVPSNLDLKELIDKRVLVIGSYNKSTRNLIVSDARNMEVLPKSPVPVPTNSPTATPTPTANPTDTPIPSLSPSPSPEA